MKNKPYQIIITEEYITIKLIGICEFQSAKSFNTDLEPHMNDSTPHMVVNCEHLVSLSKEWIREMISMQISLKTNGKLLRLLLLSQDMKKHLKEQGLDTTFKLASNLREALTDFGLVTKKMLNTDFINPFLTATLHVLKVQASITAQTGKIYAKSPENKYVGDISGVIGIVSDAFNGSVVISFPSATFLKVMSGMLGEVYTEVDKEILDGAGEITNMIFGQAKIVLNEKGYGIKTALPSVVTGKDHSLTSMTKGPVVVVPFTSDAGDFFVEICLSE